MTLGFKGLIHICLLYLILSFFVYFFMLMFFQDTVSLRSDINKFRPSDVIVHNIKGVLLLKC